MNQTTPIRCGWKNRSTQDAAIPVAANAVAVAATSPEDELAAVIIPLKICLDKLLRQRDATFNQSNSDDLDEFSKSERKLAIKKQRYQNTMRGNVGAQIERSNTRSDDADNRSRMFAILKVAKSRGFAISDSAQLLLNYLGGNKAGNYRLNAEIMATAKTLNSALQRCIHIGINDGCHMDRGNTVFRDSCRVADYTWNEFRVTIEPDPTMPVEPEVDEELVHRQHLEALAKAREEEIQRQIQEKANKIRDARVAAAGDDDWDIDTRIIAEDLAEARCQYDEEQRQAEESRQLAEEEAKRLAEVARLEAYEVARQEAAIKLAQDVITWERKYFTCRQILERLREEKQELLNLRMEHIEIAKSKEVYTSKEIENDTLLMERLNTNDYNLTVAESDALRSLTFAENIHRDANKTWQDSDILRNVEAEFEWISQDYFARHRKLPRNEEELEREKERRRLKHLSKPASNSDS